LKVGPARATMRGMSTAVHPARRVAALVAALGTVVPLGVLRLAGWEHGSMGGSGGFGRANVEYELNASPAWSGATATSLAVLIAIAAAGLWAARDRRVLALVVAAGLAGAAGTVVATADAATAGVSTRADFAALPLGTSRAAVHERLGRAPGSGSGRLRDGTPLDCDAYWGRHNGQRFLYCFAADRLAFKDAA
jgi:hypothetical protein